MKVDVDPHNIKENRTKMLDKINEILDNIQEINKKVEESKEVFDTPAATSFRDSANEYIFESKNYINNVLIPIVSNLDNVAQVYEDAIEAMNGSVS